MVQHFKLCHGRLRSAIEIAFLFDLGSSSSLEKGLFGHFTLKSSTTQTYIYLNY